MLPRQRLYVLLVEMVRGYAAPGQGLWYVCDPYVTWGGIRVARGLRAIIPQYHGPRPPNGVPFQRPGVVSLRP